MPAMCSESCTFIWQPSVRTRYVGATAGSADVAPGAGAVRAVVAVIPSRVRGPGGPFCLAARQLARRWASHGSCRPDGGPAVSRRSAGGRRGAPLPDHRHGDLARVAEVGLCLLYT